MAKRGRPKKEQKSGNPRGRTTWNKECYLCDSTDTKYYHSAQICKLLNLLPSQGIFLCEEHYEELEKKWKETIIKE